MPHRAPLSESIFLALRDSILGGELAAGEPLPSERVLSEQLGCSRHAIREAVKRLQQAGLVEVSHGGATRVLDWRATGGLDLLAQLPLDPPQPELLRSLLEMRLSVGVDAARRCAERAPAAIVAALRDGAAQHAALDSAQAPLHYAALWNHIIDGADNIAYRLAYNSLLAGLDPAGALSQSLFAAEARDDEALRTLVDAIAARDPDAAGAAAEDLLTRAPAAVLAAAAAAAEERAHG